MLPLLTRRTVNLKAVAKNLATMTVKKQINFLRGWPNPALLPTKAIQKAATTALSDPKISTPALLYGPDPGYQPLRESIVRWLGEFQGGGVGDGDAGRICITGGASMQSFLILNS